MSEDTKAAREARMLRLYIDQGLSTSIIGERFGVSASEVARILNRLGAQMRPKGRPFQ